MQIALHRIYKRGMSCLYHDGESLFDSIPKKWNQSWLKAALSSQFRKSLNHLLDGLRRACFKQCLSNFVLLPLLLHPIHRKQEQLKFLLLDLVLYTGIEAGVGRRQFNLDKDASDDLETAFET